MGPPDKAPAASLRPRVLCVVPTHGRPVLLQRALLSIRGQTHTPDEVVVVDDMSDPEIEHLVTVDRDDPSVAYVALPRELAGTASASRNYGAARSDTELIAFLDDDDAWSPSFLERLIDALGDGSSDLAVCWNRLDRDGRTLDVLERMPPRVDVAAIRAVNPGLTGSNFVIRRTAFDRIGGFDPALPVFNDLDFFVRFIGAGGTYRVVTEQLVTQYSHGGDQLSLRGPRRATGVRLYIEKHRSSLDRLARRRLQRELYVAERYPGRSRASALLYFVLSWLYADPRDVLTAMRRRIERSPRAYG